MAAPFSIILKSGLVQYDANISTFIFSSNIFLNHLMDIPLIDL